MARALPASARRSLPVPPLTARNRFLWKRVVPAGSEEALIPKEFCVRSRAADCSTGMAVRRKLAARRGAAACWRAHPLVR